jgi:hypothetical protein
MATRGGHHSAKDLLQRHSISSSFWQWAAYLPPEMIRSIETDLRAVEGYTSCCHHRRRHCGHYRSCRRRHRNY